MAWFICTARMFADLSSLSQSFDLCLMICDGTVIQNQVTVWALGAPPDVSETDLVASPVAESAV